MVECGSDSDGKPVGDDVFEAEEAAEEKLAGQGEAEGVEGGGVDEAAEFDGCGGERGEESQFVGLVAWEDGGDQPIESGGPEHRAAVLVEKPWKMEWGQAPDQAGEGGS